MIVLIGSAPAHAVSLKKTRQAQQLVSVAQWTELAARLAMEDKQVSTINRENKIRASNKEILFSKKPSECPDGFFVWLIIVDSRYISLFELSTNEPINFSTYQLFT